MYSYQSNSLFSSFPKILNELNPPTKVIEKFLRTWGDREKHRSIYTTTLPTPSYVNGQNPADITLTLSRRLIAIVRVKNILHIEAGLEMIALAMAISSEVNLKIMEVTDNHPRIRIMGFFQKWLVMSEMF